MFETDHDIYSYLGQTMFDRLPDVWDTARLDVLIQSIDRSSSIGAFYSHNDVESRFDLDKINGVLQSTDCDLAFFALYKLMQKGEKDIPWNKARFQITSEGDFEIDFKYDEDFEWYKALDIDSKEYDDLDIDIINQIKSWEGLPEGAPRYWKQ